MKDTLIGRLLRQILTDADDRSYEISAVIGFLGMLVYFGLSIANWRDFKPQEWGIGFGGAVAGMGVAINLKVRAERPKEP